MVFSTRNILAVVAIAALYNTANGFEFNPEEMLQKVNQMRQNSGKGPLKFDEDLMRAAQQHSIDQAKAGKMTHDGLGNLRGDIGDRMSQVGFEYKKCAENVAAGQENVQEVMQSWENSAGHRKNLLGDFDCVGFGYAYNPSVQYKHYWTQNFGSRKNGGCEAGQHDGGDAYGQEPEQEEPVQDTPEQAYPEQETPAQEETPEQAYPEQESPVQESPVQETTETPVQETTDAPVQETTPAPVEQKPLCPM